MSRHIPSALRQQVVERAQNHCEYCGLSQKGQAATFHIDHIVPVRVGGQTSADNLALACVGCSLYKAAQETAVDPLTGETVPLFHPRNHVWADHFQWAGTDLIGLTGIGRATIVALKMNRPIMLSIRKEEEWLGRHPFMP